ncbi:MAG: hypothetical protein NTX56_04040 [Proteobacteria bacterium]|nr:hypothetical protein [Pseudomonadota bacterium]
MNKKKPIGLYDKRSGSFGFDKLELDTKTELDGIINRLIKEAVGIATKEYECHAWFPREWSKGDGIDNTDVADPTTIYVELPLGDDEDSSPRWKFLLSDLVNSVIELHECGEGGPIGDESRPALVDIRDGLRALADRLDSALNRLKE